MKIYKIHIWFATCDTESVSFFVTEKEKYNIKKAMHNENRTIECMSTDGVEYNIPFENILLTMYDKPTEVVVDEGSGDTTVVAFTKNGKVIDVVDVERT